MSKDINLSNLPKEWEWKKIGELGKVVTGTTPLKKEAKYYGNFMPFVKPPELRNGLVNGADDNLSELGVKVARIAPPRSVLVSCIGIIGKTGFTTTTVAFNQQINAIIPEKGIDPKFVFYCFQSAKARERLKNLSSATTVAIINKSKFQSIIFPLPPLDEQQRIIAKIEELFTQIDAGVAALEQARARLKRYRQAVLHAAVTGKLTEEWREAYPKDTSSIVEVLHKTLLERKNKNPKYQLPLPLEFQELPHIPPGWTWANIQQLADATPNAIKAGPYGSSLKKEDYVPSGYKIYGQEQVTSQDPFYGDYYIDEKKYTKLQSCAVKPGDILISLVGTIGKILILPEGIDRGIINPRLLKLSLDNQLILAKYFKIYLESSNARNYLSAFSHGQTMDVLNLGILKTLPIPLPSILEQKEIIAEVEHRLSITDETEKAINQFLQRASRLRQAILQRAFSGKLVL